MKKPVIMIFPSNNGKETFLNDRYSKALLYHGAIPLIVPVGTDKETLSQIIEKADGFLFAGGVDLDPVLYGEEKVNDTVEIDPKRDKTELDALSIIKNCKKPVLGICRGIQSVNVGYGGTLYQDIPAQVEGAVCHRQTIPGEQPSHKVIIEKDSRFYKALGKDTVMTNSFHHQSVKEAAPGLKVAARSEDGLIEALEGEGEQWIELVQWHPEFTYNTDEASEFIFSSFAEAAKKEG